MQTMFAKVCLLLSVLNRCLGVDITYHVEEGKGPGIYVGDIAADSHLLDSILNQERSLITFSQLQPSQTGSSNLFRVSKKTGKVYTVHTLDAESMCKYNKECYRIIEVAVQKGASFIKVLEVKVILKDVNDHRPEFTEQQVNIQISEDVVPGTKISIPNAIDKDVGVLNSQITYKLKKETDEPFTLFVSKSVDGTSELFINLEEKLNREIKDNYVIQVIAKDGGSPAKQNVLNVNIAVTDVNDNSPVFSHDVYNITAQNEPSEISPVFILSAKDLDSGRNGHVSYHFSSKTSDIAKSHFKINELTGEILLYKAFVLGQELTYELYVKATDNGNPPLSSIAMVLINVINQQNNAPTIDVNFVTTSMGNMVEIPENTEVGSFIAYVKVTDHDAGQNGEVTCTLHHDKFQLQSLGTNKYKVFVNKPLDRETQDYHDIKIRCQDKGSPPLYSESKFSIKVMDVNDVRPTFSKKIFKFCIYENRKPNFPVGFINATDPDLGSGSKLTYFLLADSKYFLPFLITDDGLILTIMSLDHEFQDVYEFQVLVKDNGQPSLNNTVNVVVEVKDENDNAPYFTFPSVNPFTLEVTYYPHYTKNITVIRALDSDGRQNAFLKYEIAAGNDKLLFTINHYTGLLSFTRVVTQFDAGSYELQFIVKDSGIPVLSDTTTIFLILTVSNHSYEILDVHIDTTEADETIYLDFLIVIVSVAVTLSVIITAIISICFLRLSNRKNLSHRKEGSCSIKCEQRQLMCPSYLAASCTEVPVIGMNHQNIARNSRSLEFRRESHPNEELDLVSNGSTLVMDFQTASEVVYQEIGGLTESRKNNKRTALIVPNSHKEISVLSSIKDTQDSWSKEQMVYDGDTPEQYSSHYSLAHAPWTDFNTFMKPIKQRFSCPGDTRLSPRCSFKPKMGNITESGQQDGLVPAKPWTLPESRKPNFDFPQLPVVKKSDNKGSGEHLVQLPLPKYYVLEQNPGNCPQQKLYSDSLREMERSGQLPLPKYYVVESNVECLPHAEKRRENSTEVDCSIPLPIPKYYVLERDSQSRPQITRTQTPDPKV